MYLIYFLINQKKIYRKIFLIILDILTILLSFFVTFYLIYSDLDFFLFLNQYYFYFLLFSFFGFLIYFLTGQYSGITRYIGSKDLYFQCLRNFILLIVVSIISKIKDLPDFTIIYLLNFFIILTGIGGFTRFFIRDILFSIYKNKSVLQPRIAVYGAGAAGVQLYNTLRYSRRKNVVAFLDDSEDLVNRKINNINIYSPQKFPADSLKIDQILLAIPSASKERVKEILNYLEKFNIPVFKIPSIEEITSGKIKIDSIQPISVEDLLGREIVEPNKELMNNAIEGKNICITGAAGSIGTELVMQVFNLNPKKIVLIDNSEMNLYSLSLKVENLNSSIPYQLVLGSSTDYKFLKELFIKNKINTVYHAAAYKHVPLVERNPIQAIYNNVFSTYYLCKAAKKSQVKRVTLISSDKAVRPTNVMGATKRLSELILIGFANHRNTDLDFSKTNSSTIFSMVRFGNVLGSSGSVVPKFQSQISKGECITLTHPDIVRFFMSVSEAVQLVIQSSTIAKGGEVFLLDMGDPIPIKEIATKLVLLRGRTIKNKENIDGDIEIKITGLRPGEKLHEELLVNSESSSTEHNLIYKSKEKINIDEVFWDQINILKEEIKKNNERKIIILLSKLVPEWKISNLIKDTYLK